MAAHSKTPWMASLLMRDDMCLASNMLRTLCSAVAPGANATRGRLGRSTRVAASAAASSTAAALVTCFSIQSLRVKPERLSTELGGV